MGYDNARSAGEPKMVNVLKEDLHRGDFARTVKRDFNDLKEFMLDEDRQKRLKEMGRVRGWLHVCWWLLKSLFMKLTPARRILVILGIIMLWSIRWRAEAGQVSIDVDFTLAGGFILLFVLMLELKDKLVARKELEAGRAVQEALLPQRSPSVPGWNLWLFSRSANEVGGDLVDFVKVGNGRFGIAVGDVAGKGLRAALLSSKLQATLRALVTEQASLSMLAAKLNQIFCRDSLPNLFASLVYVEVQQDSGAIRTVNAGHIPPLMVKGASVAKMQKGGPALGLMPEATFTEQPADLEHGSLLLIYSDGLTEAQNDGGEFFGEQRLLTLLPQLNALSANQLGERLVAEVDRFVGEGRPTDDLSIALLART